MFVLLLHILDAKQVNSKQNFWIVRSWSLIDSEETLQTKRLPSFNEVDKRVFWLHFERQKCYLKDENRKKVKREAERKRANDKCHLAMKVGLHETNGS